LGGSEVPSLVYACCRYVHYDQTNNAMTMTCACKMQSYVCKELGQPIIYLSPMHITQRAIIGYDVLDTDLRLVNLDML
jgi:hypothetical protein